MMRLASTMPGFTASRSCQRSPLPKFCCAIFHSESPGFTTTTLSFAAPFGATGTTGATGAVGAGAEAAGSGGGTRMAGGCDSKTFGGATKTRGRSNGERFTGGRYGPKRGGAGFATGGCSGITGGFGEGKMELRGLLKFLRLLLFAETARDVTERSVGSQRLRVDGFGGFFHRR